MSSCVLCGNPETPSIEKPAHHACQITNGQPCAPCRQMKQLEDHISAETIAIQEILDSIKQKLAQHRELRMQANHLHDPLIFRLPLETASSIFHFYVSQCWLFKGGGPLILGAVCRSWRQIAWSTPQLWNYISIVLNPLKFPGHCEAVREWIGRSGQLPLFIWIKTCKNPISNEMDSVIDVMNAYSSRWYDLDLLFLPSFLVSRFVGDSRAAYTPILRTLKLGYFSVQGNGRFRLKNVIPAPTKVTLWNFRLKVVHIEWNNATEVKLRSPHLEECIEVLRRSPRLLQYTINDVLPRQRRSRWKIPENPIIHSLRRLSVSHYPANDDNFNGDMHIFFNSFTLPALQYLCYGEGDWPGSLELEYDSLKSLFGRSTCPLTELIIEARFTQEDEIIDFLRATPSSLRKLELIPWNQETDYTPKSLFRLLASTSSTTRDEGDSFLPSLESIKFCPVCKFPWKLVPGIFSLVSEMNNPHRRPLHKLQLSFQWREELGSKIIPYMDKKTIHRILELIDAGISRKFGIEGDDSSDLLKLSMEHHGMARGSNMTSNS